MTVIRPADPADAPEIRRLLHDVALWTETFGRRVWQEEELDRCTHPSSLADGRWFGAFDPEGLAACMRVDASDPTHWPDDGPGDAIYLHKVAVARRAAGRGWAGRLVETATEIAAGTAVRFLRLDTLPRAKLIGLYHNLGFRLVDEHPSLFAGRELVRMERGLGGSRPSG